MSDACDFGRHDECDSAMCRCICHTKREHPAESVSGEPPRCISCQQPLMSKDGKSWCSTPGCSAQFQPIGEPPRSEPPMEYCKFCGQHHKTADHHSIPGPHPKPLYNECCGTRTEIHGERGPHKSDCSAGSRPSAPAPNAEVVFERSDCRCDCSPYCDCPCHAAVDLQQEAEKWVDEHLAEFNYPMWEGLRGDPVWVYRIVAAFAAYIRGRGAHKWTPEQCEQWMIDNDLTSFDPATGYFSNGLSFAEVLSKFAAHLRGK